MTTRKFRQLNSKQPAILMSAMLAIACVLCQPHRALGQWATNGTNIYNTNSGNVGIGTSTPTGVLQVQSNFSDSGNGTPMAIFKQTNSGSFPYVQMDRAALWRSNALIFSTAGSVDWSMGTFYNGGSSNSIFSIGYSAGVTPSLSQGQFNITTGGYVGIGTSSPSTALHVIGDLTLGGTGNIVANGNIAAKYQDVAEWVPASRQMAAGTVVVLDRGQSNHVLASTSAYDTGVAGVISSRPGLTLGEGGQGKVLVATTGRVKVKADATRAAIKVGDLLVTSDKEGAAMRSEPLSLGGVAIHRPGTLIGKALEPLDKGRGEILVLLSLQ